jgi:hypothetical protein
LGLYLKAPEEERRFVSLKKRFPPLSLKKRDLRQKKQVLHERQKEL